MSNDTTITIVGNLTADPEMRFTPNGSAVANFSVAATPRRYDTQASAWVDGEALFMRCTAWRDLAENITETLSKGQRVIVTGRLRANRWETPEGEKRFSVDLDVDDIGPSLRWATAKVTKVTRDRTTPSPTAGADPWTAPTNGQAASRQAAGSVPDEPPF